MALYGVYRGVVLDSSDPLASGRVRVDVMGIQGWAPVAVSGAAESSANIYVGNTVIVAFEQGEPSRPVVLGRIKKAGE